MSNEPAALSQSFFSVLCVLGGGVTGELALPLACHPPRPSMESRSGGGGGSGGGGVVSVPFTSNNS